MQRFAPRSKAAAIALAHGGLLGTGFVGTPPVRLRPVSEAPLPKRNGRSPPDTGDAEQAEENPQVPLPDPPIQDLRDPALRLPVRPERNRLPPHADRTGRLGATMMNSADEETQLLFEKTPEEQSSRRKKTRSPGNSPGDLRSNFGQILSHLESIPSTFQYASAM